MRGITLGRKTSKRVAEVIGALTPRAVVKGAHGGPYMPAGFAGPIAGAATLALALVKEAVIGLLNAGAAVAQPWGTDNVPIVVARPTAADTAGVPKPCELSAPGPPPNIEP